MLNYTQDLEQCIEVHMFLIDFSSLCLWAIVDLPLNSKIPSLELGKVELHPMLGKNSIQTIYTIYKVGPRADRYKWSYGTPINGRK